MHLVVDKVDQFQHIHITDRRAVLERLARSAVKHLEFTVHLAFGVEQVVFLEQLFDVLFGRKITERKLQCFIQPAVYGLVRNGKPVVRNTDMSYLSLLFCL